MLSMLGWKVAGYCVMPMVSWSRAGWASAGAAKNVDASNNRPHRIAQLTTTPGR